MPCEDTTAQASLKLRKLSITTSTVCATPPHYCPCSYDTRDRGQMIYHTLSDTPLHRTLCCTSSDIAYIPFTISQLYHHYAVLMYTCTLWWQQRTQSPHSCTRLSSTILFSTSPFLLHISSHKHGVCFNRCNHRCLLLTHLYFTWLCSQISSGVTHCADRGCGVHLLHALMRVQVCGVYVYVCKRLRGCVWGSGHTLPLLLHAI